MRPGMRRLFEKIKKKMVSIKKEPFYGKLIDNALISLVGEGGASVISLVTTILLIRLIGSPNYGIMTVAYAFVMVVDTLVNFQCWKGMITFGGRAMEEGDYGLLQSYIKVGTLIDVVTAILGALIAFSAACILGMGGKWNADTLQAIQWFSLIVLFNFSGTSVGIIRLFNVFKIFSVFRIVHASLKLLGVIVACFILDLGLKGAVLAFVFGEVLGYLFLLVKFLILIHKDQRVSIKGIVKSPVRGVWKEFFGFTFWTSLTASVDIPVQELDVIILSVVSYEAVAVFKVYKQIAQALNKLTTPLTQAILPQFSEMVARGEEAQCYDYMISIRNKSFKILFPGVAVLGAGSLLVMHFWLGDLYVSFWYALIFLLAARAYALSYTAINPLVIAVGEVKRVFWYTLFANIVFLILSFLLVRKLSILGSVIAITAEYLILVNLKKMTLKSRLKNLNSL